MCEDGIKQLLQNLFERAFRAETAHYKVSGILQKKYRRLGAISGAIGAIVTTSIFATLQGEEYMWIRLLTGLVSILANIMNFLQNFLKYGEWAEEHRKAAQSYSALKREVEFCAWFPEIATQEYINNLRLRWDELNATCPTVDEKIWAKLSGKDFSRYDAQILLNGNGDNGKH